MNMLKRLRVEAGISLKKLSAATGVDPATISQLENDRRKAQLTTLAKLARYFDKPVEDFQALVDGGNVERGRLGGLASVAKKAEGTGQGGAED